MADIGNVEVSRPLDGVVHALTRALMGLPCSRNGVSLYEIRLPLNLWEKLTLILEV